jgi:hypothetical protein
MRSPLATTGEISKRSHRVGPAADQRLDHESAMGIMLTNFVLNAIWKVLYGLHVSKAGAPITLVLT